MCGPAHAARPTELSAEFLAGMSFQVSLPELSDSQFRVPCLAGSPSSAETIPRVLSRVKVRESYCVTVTFKITWRVTAELELNLP
jgi:hypothetical protein